jgi:putative redox protein
VPEAGLAVRVAVGPHTLQGDEPREKGGTDTGPAPHELLVAALATCTAMTLRLCASRKGWPLRDSLVRLSAATVEGAFVIRKVVTIEGDLDADQRARLLEVADRCPVQRTLSAPSASRRARKTGPECRRGARSRPRVYFPRSFRLSLMPLFLLVLEAA